MVGLLLSSTQLWWGFSILPLSGFRKFLCPTIDFPITTRARNIILVASCTICVSTPYRGNGSLLLLLYLFAYEACFAKYTPKRTTKLRSTVGILICALQLFTLWERERGAQTYLCHIRGHFVQLTVRQSYTCKCCQRFWFGFHETVFAPEVLWRHEFSLAVSFSFDALKRKKSLITTIWGNGGWNMSNSKTCLPAKHFP